MAEAWDKWWKPLKGLLAEDKDPSMVARVTTGGRRLWWLWRQRKLLKLVDDGKNGGFGDHAAMEE